jgi:CzcA family heavy metal efflux pump
MGAIVKASLKFRLLVVIAAGALLTVGVAQLREMKTDAYPEFAPPSVDIQTEALGLSASEVEQLITVPLEADLLNGVAWVDKIRSQSIAGLSSITLTFEPGTNLLRARQMVSERLNTPAAIPNVSKAPVMLPPMSSTSRVMMIGLSSKDMSLIDIGVLARWTIRPRLIGVPGVANVAIWGQRERQLQVQVDPQRLHDRGVSLSQVLNTTGNSLWVSPLTFLEASTPGTGGFFDTPNQRLAIRHVSPITKADELARVPVEAAEGEAAPTVDGHTLRLSDVADVVEDHQPLIGDAIVNGQPGLMLVVEKLPTANTIEVTRGVEDAVAALRPGLGTLKLDTSVFRPATFMHRAVHDVGTTLFIGIGLMILAVALLLYAWRAAVVAVVAILCSLVAAALVLYLRGATMNTLAFAGLVVAVGVVIDDAVTAAHGVARRPASGPDRSLAASVLEAVMRARTGLLFATLIILLPLVPVFFLGHLGAALGHPLALSYALALLASMVVALSVAPALSVLLFSGAATTPRESPVIRWLKPRYSRLLSRATQTSRPALLTFAVLAVIGVIVVPQLRQSTLPTFKETDFLIDLEAPPGTSLPEMDRITTQASRELRALPGVRNVGGHVGRAITGDQVSNPNASELWISLSSKANYDRTVAAVRRVIKGYPGIESDVKTYSQAKFGDVQTGTDEPVVVRVYGAELDVLRQQAQDVTRAMSGIKGITDLHAELPNQEPTIQVEVNLDAAKAAGIKPGDVRRAAAVLVSGVQAGSLFEEQKVFDVVVWGTPATRRDVSAVRNLLIDTPSGSQVRLGDVARVDVKPSPNVIERDAVSRRVDVTAQVHGRSRSGVLADVRQRLQSVKFPLEYRYELVSNFADRAAIEHRLVLLGIGVAIGTFLLLQAAFGSWRLAVLQFLTLPLALVGGTLAVLLAGGNIELGSAAGLLAVFAIAVRNGVVLLQRFQRLEQGEGNGLGRDLVLQGAGDRFTPILVTAVATAIFFAPFVFLGDLPGHEIVSPMGRAVLGGLVTSTIVGLFLLPALYLRFAYGRASSDELDLRDLWEEKVVEPAVATDVDGNGHKVGSEVGAGAEAPEAWPS